jgi:predicted RNase H-like nuclease (RuvC/YqgF family)
MNDDGGGRMDERLLSEVVQRLTRIEVKLEEIVAVKKDIKDLTDTTDELKKDIIELKAKDEQQRKELDEIRDNSKWISRAVIGAVITSSVAIIFALIKLGLKI